MERYTLGYNPRVSAELGTDRYQESLVALRIRTGNDWDITMSPYQARKLARTLTKVANFIDPPKPRKARA